MLLRTNTSLVCLSWRDILGDGVLRHLFKNYLDSIFAPESFAFRVEVEKYISLFNTDDGMDVDAYIVKVGVGGWVALFL